jgi:hypothetical protein
VPKLTNTRIVHEAALYYAAYKLTLRGWEVEVKPSGEKGADLIIYDRNREKRHTIKVKGLSNRDPIPFGEGIESLPEYVIVVRDLEKPEVFVLDRDTVKKRVQASKGSKMSYWIETKRYEEFKDRWDLITS